MKEHPILFSGPMVKAILEGRETQTRRIVDWKRLHKQAGLTFPTKCRLAWFTILNGWGIDAGDSVMRAVDCPYGQPGSRLWLKETWQYADWTDDGYPFIRYAANNETKLIESGIPDAWEQKLEDAWCRLSTDANYAIDQKAADRVWRPSIFMPRWASRITLKVTAVRVERLQNISENDALAEGVESWKRGETYEAAKSKYAALWESINGPGSWAKNPWVWALSFKRITP